MDVWKTKYKKKAAKFDLTDGMDYGTESCSFCKQKYNLNPDDYPKARIADACSMAIPLHNKMTPEDYDYVANTIKEIK